MNQHQEHTLAAFHDLRESLTEAFLVLRQVYQYAHMDAATVNKVKTCMENAEIALSKTDNMDV